MKTSILFRQPPGWMVVTFFLAAIAPFGFQILSCICYAALVSGCMRGRRGRRRIL